MKEKILAAIKAKFPKVNLSKARLNAIAAKIETKVIDDETKIDAAIDEYNDFNPLADIAKNDDKIRNLEAKVVTPAPAKKEENQVPAEIEVPDDVPPYMKAIIEQNKKISEQLAAIQGEKAKGTVRTEAEKLLKDIPVSYWGKRAIPEKAEDMEAFVEDVTNDYTAFKQELTNQGLSIIPKPGGGTEPPKPGTVSPEVKAHMDAKAKQVPVPPANKATVISNK